MNTLHLMDYAFELRLALILLLVVVNLVLIQAFSRIDAFLDKRRANKPKNLSADAYATLERALEPV